LKLTKVETIELLKRVEDKLRADRYGYSSCQACGRPLSSGEMGMKGWLSGKPLGLCAADAHHVNNHLLVDFQEQLGYND